MRLLAGLLIASAIVAGTLADRVSRHAPRTLGGYRVTAADFHDHPVLLGAWDLVLDARRQHLDAFALTPHNQIVSATVGRWFSKAIGGPTVLVGEEVRGQKYHLIAVGISERVTWDQPAAAAIAEIHRQGGIAIAAHPTRDYWPAFDAEAMRTLDGAEVMHPASFRREAVRHDFEDFFRRAVLTAIGSSDYHGVGRMGMCRTYVFAADDSEPAILDALRRHRTVVYDADGRAFGDPDLIRLAEGKLPKLDDVNAPANDPLSLVSRIAGTIGLLILLAGPQGPAYVSEP